ncbi:MAG: serine/threonine protein kinase [Myxococcales bacterium]|nr:serine/threonine protein kinase [Myxococcales bacterium]
MAKPELDEEALSGPTLLPDGSLSSPVDPKVDLETLRSASKYEVGDRIGLGGMGEVRLCRDTKLGREVAMKLIRSGEGSGGDRLMRFLREARVQGQIEHPSIVPVYDLGLGPSGEPYFTMKLVRGVTLEGVLAGLRSNDPAFTGRWNRHRLLTAFGTACLAVDLAHARGVVHRDLKPANLMLGDFGEVYVLDWGLAKVLGAEESRGGPISASELQPNPSASDSAKTQLGTLLGTPGYMSPEQIDGGAIDARSDVYSLGAILFELVTLKPLVPANPLLAIEATRGGVDARARALAPEMEVPPELEAICVKATARDPGGRFPSARALHQALEEYLAGERDQQLRVEKAREHAAVAAEAASLALTRGALEDRTRAVREVGRSLALDPANESALRTLMKLLEEPPPSLPEEAERALQRSAARSWQAAARTALLAFGQMFLYIPLLWWMGIRHPPGLVVFFLCNLLVVAGAAMAYRASRDRPRGMWAMTAAVCAAVASTSVFFGPFIVVPGFAAVNIVASSLMTDRVGRRLALAGGVLAVVVPAGLMLWGLFPVGYLFGPEGMTVTPGVVELPRWPTLTVLLCASIGTVVVSALAVGRLRDALSEAERQLNLRAWTLRQLLPAARAPDGEGR